MSSIFVIYLAALNCSNDENGRCEDLCINMEGFVSCGCINETLVPPDNRTCVCKSPTHIVSYFIYNTYNHLYS